MIACASHADRHISTPPERSSSDVTPGDVAPNVSAPDARVSSPRALWAPQPSTRGDADTEFVEVTYPFPVRYRSFHAQGLPLRMAYMDVAPPTAALATVVLLHGKNFSGAYWEATAGALVGAGFRVVMPDQVGFGKSSKPTAYQYSFQALATHTRELLDELGVESAHVVGHSMGGMLAVRYALMFPKQSRSLVLVNPIGLEDYGQQLPYPSIDAWTADERGKDLDAVREYMKQNYFAGEWKPEYEPLLAIQRASLASPAWPELALVSAKLYDMILTQPVVGEFHRLQVPTLLIIGQRDRTAVGKAWAAPDVRETLGDYPRLGREAARAIPKAKLVELPKLGHLPQFEAPSVAHAALLDFLCQAGPCRQAESR
ncbi:MAG TPA: alpha/beta hydrolase [Polyangiaceae bacterium]